MGTLDRAWQVGSAPPGALTAPPEPEGRVQWLAATVPGTVASALAAAGRPEPVGEDRIDEQDWWFRTTFDSTPPMAGERVVLRVGGIATVWEIYLNGDLLLSDDSMFAEHEIDVGDQLRDTNDLAVCCRALRPLLDMRRRPRARWRTRLADANLRFFRTSLLGRAPGFAPGPPPIGPWRPITLERRSGPALSDVRLRPRIAGDEGLLTVHATVSGAFQTQDIEVTVEGPSGVWSAPLAVTGTSAERQIAGEVRVPDVARWWPHTHGSPVLHTVRLRAGEAPPVTRRVGFRTLEAGADLGHDVGTDGLDLHVNGTPVFARGAVWTPVDPRGFAPGPGQLRDALDQVRDAGMNMLRIPGNGVYETAEFHDLCDELGLLVWQDFMFANFDYPVQDEDFRSAVEREARQVLEQLAGRPSLAVLCGNSEVEQQVAMVGLDPAIGRGPLFDEILPAEAAAAEADAVYVTSAPSGVGLAFRPSAGVANYFGVGGYRRPLSDARLAGVRFASECLAFANLPDGEDGGTAAVPRDVGSDWDFADVRDHYLAVLHDVDPVELRHSDPARYAELSRSVPGEVMAEVMGEWRRAESPCRGALVLWLRDVVPGAGWGVIDHTGAPKEPYHHLRRVLAPVAVWTTDEGLGGVAVHVANDRDEPMRGVLRIVLYRDLEHVVESVERPLELAAHESWSGDIEEVLGHFRDLSFAYRFGPPAVNAVVVTLLPIDEGPFLSQAFRFPVGRPLARQAAGALGFEATIVRDGDATALRLASKRLVYGLHIHLPGWTPADDALSLEPGWPRTVPLRRTGAGQEPPAGVITALNLDGEQYV